jgi:hypothetical protein
MKLEAMIPQLPTEAYGSLNEEVQPLRGNVISGFRYD